MKEIDFTISDKMRAKLVALDNILSYCNDCVKELSKEINISYENNNDNASNETKFLSAQRSVYYDLIEKIEDKISNAL